MTDQAAYRRYTQKAEELLKAAEQPAYIIDTRGAPDVDPTVVGRLKEALGGRVEIQHELPEPTVTHLGGTDPYIAAAAVYATLALAAAQERVQPADRPTDRTESPAQVRDGEGDLWNWQPGGLYAMASLPEHPHWTLEKIAAQFNGYTEVT